MTECVSEHLDTWNMNVANVHLYLNNRDQLSVCSYWEWRFLALFHKQPEGLNLTPLPPSLSLPHYDPHQMPTIPGQRSQSMLGRTKADLQPIGSTLLTACNLLMSLARPHRAGVRANRWVCPLSLLWCRAAFSLWKVLLCYISIVAAAPVCLQEHMEKSVTGNC